MLQSQSQQIAILEQLAQAVHMPTVATLLLRTAVVVTLWTHRAKSRRALLNLDADLLRDVGISPSDAHDEATKPFWR